jgi:UDP-glucose 4-epimerase
MECPKIPGTFGGKFLSPILITGARGLIGTALTRRLTAAGQEVVAFDIADPHNGHRMDVTDSQSIAAAIEGCSGIVHLAAVSRVVWGERDPALCRKVNVRGTRNILAAVARNESQSPWVLVASSREVYGQATELPVRESAPFCPLNVYARSKVDVEHMVASSRREGVRASVIRFSSVYGATTDHPDRVVPAFVRLAVAGDTLHVDGAGTTLDFTHVEDVAAALYTAIELLSAGDDPLPPLHLVSGRGITLPELAELAIKAAGEGVVEVGPPRSYDVSTFIGDPARAEQILGWRASIGIEEGIYRLAERFRAADYWGHAEGGTAACRL